MLNFDTLKDKPVLIVNVASYCGYTQGDYSQLVQLYDKYKGKIEILAFPCNQFGGQEPDKCDKIAHFAKDLGVEFKMMNKIDVNGEDTHPVYKFLKRKLPGDIAWNFEKFLVDSNGKVLKRYKSNISPETIDPDVAAASIGLTDFIKK